jgi:hypothetical protein
MPDRLPIQDAKEIAHKRGLRQVILLAWDGERSHVVTYGKSIEDCDQAAQGGEKLKKVLGWPNWEAQPSRVKKLSEALKPFAGIRLTSDDGSWDGSGPEMISGPDLSITPSDVHRARAALEKVTPTT